MEELESKHKKALKALDGEKRAAIKKAKGTKGKKAKEALAEVEEEFATKLKQLEESYAASLKELQSSGGGSGGNDNDNAAKDDATAAEATTTTAAESTTQPPQGGDADNEEESPEDAGLSAKEKKLAKARRKKERQKEKELQRQREIEEETKRNADGPSMKKHEIEQLTQILSELNFKIQTVDADGHCLYRAIGAHVNRSYQEIRKLFGSRLSFCFVFFVWLGSIVGSFSVLLTQNKNPSPKNTMIPFLLSFSFLRNHYRFTMCSDTHRT